MKDFLSLSNNDIVSLLGILSAITTAIVQVLKNILPKKFPTKILTVIVSVIIMLAYVIIFGTISISSILFAIFGGFIIAFIAMFGFDNFKETIDRFKIEQD